MAPLGLAAYFTPGFFADGDWRPPLGVGGPVGAGVGVELDLRPVKRDGSLSAGHASPDIGRGLIAAGVSTGGRRGRGVTGGRRTNRACSTTLSSSSGCSSRSGGTPLLGSYLPYFGNESFAFHLGNAPAAQPCVLALAAGTRVTTLVGGCTLYLDQPLFLPATASAAGVARLRLAIPDLVSLRGAQLYAQGFVLDSGNVLGIGASAARALTIGD